MVSIVSLCPGDPGSNPGWLAAGIQIDIDFFTLSNTSL